ncbi:hypothetical protein D3C81_373330 [compost metagenome]
MHDGGKHGRFHVHVRDLLGDDLAQRGHVGRMLPQLGRLGTQLRIGNLAAQLAHDDGGHHRFQGGKAQTRDGRAHIGDFIAGTVVGSRVGQRHDARRQQRLGHDHARGRLDMAIGVVQRFLQL